MTKIRQRTLIGSSGDPEAASQIHGWGMGGATSAELKRLTRQNPIVFTDATGADSFALAGVSQRKTKVVNTVVCFDTAYGSAVADNTTPDWPSGFVLTVAGVDTSGNATTITINDASTAASKIQCPGDYVIFLFEEAEVDSAIEGLLTAASTSATGSVTSSASGQITDTGGISANIVNKEWALRAEAGTTTPSTTHDVVILGNSTGSNTIDIELDNVWPLAGTPTYTTNVTKYRVYQMPVMTYEWDGAAAGGGGESSVISHEIIKRR
jgi:hypothetical protein